MLESTECFDKESTLSYRELDRSESNFDSVLEEMTLCKKEKSILISDADGVWFRDIFDQFPIISILKEPVFREDIVDKLTYINEIFSENNFFVATNRDPRVGFPWASDKVIDILEESFTKAGIDTSFIFTVMNKQLPGVAKKEIARLTEEIVKYYYANDSKEGCLQIVSMEDITLIHPFRKYFLLHIAKKVQESIDKDMDIEILNFIV